MTGERTYFRVILPAHPQYMVIHALRNSAHLWATGERRNALANLEDARKRVPTSGAIVGQLIEYRASLGELSSAENMFNENRINPELVDRHLVFLAMAKAYLNAQNPSKASSILREIPSPETEVLMAYSKAMELLPNETVFRDGFERWKSNPKKWKR